GGLRVDSANGVVGAAPTPIGESAICQPRIDRWCHDVVQSGLHDPVADAGVRDLALPAIHLWLEMIEERSKRVATRSNLTFDRRQVLIQLAFESANSQSVPTGRDLDPVSDDVPL